MGTKNLTIEEIKSHCSALEKEVLNLYLQRCTQKQICERLDISRGKIDSLVRKYNLTRFRDRKNYSCKTVNPSEPEFWYFLGLFASDGNLYLKSHCVDTIQFVLDDLDALENIKHILECSNPIKVYLRNGKYRYYMSISDTHLVKTVQRIFNSSCYRKTTTLVFPNVPNADSMKMFLRGFFDGDGSFAKSHIEGFYNFKIYCASEEFVNSLFDVLKTIVPEEKVHLYKDAYIEICSQYGVYLLCKFLYSYNPSIGIRRKRERVMQHIENYELKI